MKPVVLFENEERSCFYNVQVLKSVCSLYPGDPVVMISAGDFSSVGTLLTPSCRKRSEQYVEAGADFVFSLPVASVLGGYGKKEFAAIALVQSLRVANRLVIPCVPAPGQTVRDCGNTLRSYAKLMFMEQSGYRHRLSEYLNQMPLRDAQVRTICDCIPDADQLLCHPENRQALWLLDAMLQLYFITQVEFTGVSGSGSGEVCEKDPVYEDHFDQTAARSIADLLAVYSAEKLVDISGSTTQMVNVLLENREAVRKAGSFEKITHLLLPEPIDRIRLFLLKAILGLRKIHMQICGLHTYVPYCYVFTKNAENRILLKQLEERSWVPFIGDPVQEQAVAKDYDYLIQADKKVNSLINE